MTPKKNLPPAPTAGLATATQAAHFLALSRTTLWRLTRGGVLSPVRIGGAVRYRWADLHALAGEENGAQ